MKIEPILDNALILPDKPVEQRGAILMPPTREGTLTGTILSIGPGRIAPKGGALIPPTVKVGDRVWYQRQMGTELKSEGRLVRMLSEKHIIAVVAAGVDLDLAPPPRPPAQDGGSSSDD